MWFTVPKIHSFIPFPSHKPKERDGGALGDRASLVHVLLWHGHYTPVLLVSTTCCLQRELIAYSPRLVPFSSLRSGFLENEKEIKKSKAVD